MTNSDSETPANVAEIPVQVLSDDTCDREERSYYLKFKDAAEQIRYLAEHLLIEEFGHRCDEYYEDCDICKRWKALDTLTENPFDPED